MKQGNIKVALVGNPNAGKSTLFNALTGMRQKTGNFPGVTVEKKSGTFRIAGDNGHDAHVTLVDLPGTYSIYPKSKDETVVMDILANPQHPDFPDVVVIVADASNLQRNLLLFTEINDLGIPSVLALNMLDVAESMNLTVNAVQLAMQLNVPVVRINARTGEGMKGLKEAVKQVVGRTEKPALRYFYEPKENEIGLINEVKEIHHLDNDYVALQYVCQHDNFSFLEQPVRAKLDALIEKYGFDENNFLANETIARYEKIKPIVSKAVKSEGATEQPYWTRKLDSILLHRVWGYVTFALVLLVVFQAIFAWASYPMDMIDAGTAAAIEWVKGTLPAGVLNDLITDGIMAGIGGIIIFIPQIAILFALVAILEESGYMARVMVIMDKLMRRFGLNGRSVVPLISGVACAVPAIMTTRSISSRYERLLTIMVTPLMSCSARLPIFTILIALVVPETKVLGIFNMQGIALFGLYLLGLLGALGSAWFLSLFIPRREPSYFMLEMPSYKLPRWGHVGFTMYESVKSFVLEAGKVIMAISIILWVLASYGPGDSMNVAEQQVVASMTTAPQEEIDAAVASARLESSYAGQFGRFIEPAIRPLGYDWKIGIALLASFAAREVFVGTMATIYSISGDTEDVLTVKQRLVQEKNPETGGQMFTPAVCYSLLMFYVFAMMCMSTIAVVYRETHGWKWPMIQLAYLMVLAYGSAFLVYQVLS
ncbi:ferrous iron transport protein B [Dyadobacter sp. BE34]|uniref:Ferrous iron transport protein B n=1 Tax=Dyadobacter fermentans TaxID=94254 RepID=A0ABU1QSG6_9BACT|nr:MULTISPECIES: ferrous iron transport protein B [Dyadobacter]MDR6804093.1 ferrous iron transport protein B [Dyadobacter fermentans]MDR7041833.1 ferrous iron transport protein B [Dyadobacter sp. BE242]MDR7196236.1 ferrous iron transport protein B [Dyadobacter sp. BE34]MDR7213219.1 ferrous iron transport protein B [Dyadobacter sp. BE31]MDR7261642.1 ferrous iron transport protein B [Dyadobacter sp. BE32]